MGTDSERAIRWLIALMVSLQVGRAGSDFLQRAEKKPGNNCRAYNSGAPRWIGIRTRSSGVPIFGA
jgi:hypothetical protein